MLRLHEAHDADPKYGGPAGDQQELPYRSSFGFHFDHRQNHLSGMIAVDINPIGGGEAQPEGVPEEVPVSAHGPRRVRLYWG
jgi:hypothetical protein